MTGCSTRRSVGSPTPHSRAWAMVGRGTSGRRTDNSVHLTGDDRIVRIDPKAAEVTLSSRRAGRCHAVSRHAASSRSVSGGTPGFAAWPMPGPPPPRKFRQRQVGVKRFPALAVRGRSRPAPSSGSSARPVRSNRVASARHSVPGGWCQSRECGSRGTATPPRGSSRASASLALRAVIVTGQAGGVQPPSVVRLSFGPKTT